MNFSSFKYVNREDDFGDEWNREAKLSYNPIGLLKNTILLRGKMYLNIICQVVGGLD